MKIGILARADTTGLGIQSKEFYDHIPCKALVIDVSLINQTMKQNHDWYPGCPVIQWTKNARFPIPVLKNFLKDINVLITFETAYDPTLFALCKAMGIKTILQLNYEFLEYPSSSVAPDLFAAPSMWHYDDIPDPKTFLPVPVNTEHFKPQIKHKAFVHNAGKPAVHDRNGTLTFLNSLKYVKNEITVILRCQQEIKNLPEIPTHIKLITEFSNTDNYWDNYQGGVMVIPRKYGGLCLPLNESIAAEMPVIMSDISPNFTWLPKDWLVPAKKSGSFQCKKMVDIYSCDPIELAAKIDMFCNEDYYLQQVIAARKLKQKISWEAMLPEYYRVLFGQ